MRLQSRGLGRKELVMDFREYGVTREGDDILIQGTIREPVRWDFCIRVCEDDLAGLLHVASRRTMLGFLLRGALRRKKQHHWSGDRDEHVKEAKEAGIALDDKLRRQRKERREQEAAVAKRAKEARASANGQDTTETPDDISSDGDTTELEAAEA